MEFRFENYGINQKIKNAINKGFIITGIVIVTKFIHSSLSSVSLYHYLHHQIPILHRHFFKIVSQDEE